MAQAIDFSDLGGREVSPSSGQIDFSDLGGKLVQPGGDGTLDMSAQQRIPASFSAVHQPTDIRGKVETWAENVMNDIKYGTDKTGVGSVLKKMGAHGVYMGNPQAVGDFMASLPLGLLRTTKGAAEVTQGGKGTQGVGDIISGALQASTMPASLVSPVTVNEAPEAALTAGKYANKLPLVGRAFASTTRAGRTFQQVNQGAGKVPVQITPELSDAALAVKDLADAGQSLPSVVGKFIRRATDPNAAPITFEEARRFAQNASRLSVSDYLQSNRAMRRLIGQFHGALNDAVQQTADKAGVGQEFAQAMRETPRR
jgi:hypothetical protein